ncbi:MAG: hypothetical protein QOE03_461 [Micromonosporaceae bacterium]|nr:hypothetical protein [Micromonosporaceae bacterium]
MTGVTDERSGAGNRLGPDAGPGRSGADAGPGGRSASPPSLRAAVGLLFTESAAVVAMVVYNGLTSTVVSWRDAVIVVGFAALLAAAFAGLGWSLARRRSWARGPAVVAELMLVPIGWYLASGGQVWPGVAVLALSLVGAGLLVAPTTREALEPD